MPPKAKTEEPVVGVPAPANLSDLCTDCDPRELDPSTTQVACPHGSWFFVPGDPAPEPTADEVRAAVLADLDEETLRALLDAKTAPPAK